MILSYHPCYVADRNILCAGRPPDKDDLSAIKSARAVVLPQGCPQPLYEMARKHCPNVFPHYDARFDYPGKTGQARLFGEIEAAHPHTLPFLNVAALTAQYPRWHATPPMALPFVFKFDWGGEGEAVFAVETPEVLAALVDQAADFEESGYSGFLFQEFIHTDCRSLRVAVIGKKIASYWRVQDGPDQFCVNLACGGKINRTADTHLQEMAKAAVEGFCCRTGINLAGFDLLFQRDAQNPMPLFLEINWFFGRRGLGGSEKFYTLLTGEIDRWLQELGTA